MLALRMIVGLLGLFAMASRFDGGSGAGGSGDGGGSGESGSGGEGDEGGQDGGSGDDGEGGGEAFVAPRDQAEFDRMVARRIKRAEERAEARGRQAAETAAQAAAEEAKAQADGDLQKQLDIANKKLADAQAEVAREKHERLRSDVARDHKLPKELAELLKGEDEAALVAHAKTLQKYAGSGSGEGGENGNGNVDNDAGATGHRKPSTSRPPAKEFKVVSRGKTVPMPG